VVVVGKAPSGISPVSAEIHWGTPTIPEISVGTSNIQRIHAVVEQGWSFDQEVYESTSALNYLLAAYAPILNAVVIARVARPMSTPVEIVLRDNGAGIVPRIAF
jgi:hypothetical protein